MGLVAVMVGRPLRDGDRGEGEPEADVLKRGELARFRAGARHINRRVGLLDGAGPDRDRAVLVVAALPAERLGLRPGMDDEVQRFLEALPRLGRVDAIGHIFVRGSAQHAGDDAAASHRVQHRELFGDSDRIEDRDVGAEQGDLRIPHPLSERTGHDHRVRGQGHGREVVLGDGDPVEADLVGELELLETELHRALGRFGRIGLSRNRPHATVGGTSIGNQ